MASEWVCESDRASDYYGLGVRLGIYFAWLQAWTANAILPSQISGALATNTVFLMTLLIAMVNDSSTGALSRLDALLLMHLCGGTVFGVLSLWGYRTRLYTQQGRGAIAFFGGYGTHIRMATALAVSLYGLWFWSWGVSDGLFPLGPGDGMDPPNPAECGTLYTFFFAKIEAAGPIRYYYIVVCACCAAYFGAMMVVSILAAWFTVERLAGTLHKRWSRAADIDKLSRPSYVTGFNDFELIWIHKILRVGNLVWLVFSAITVECSLNFNHVGGVLGGFGRENTLALPGQLLPFVIGLFGFVQLCYTIFMEKYVNAQPPEGLALVAAVEASLQPAMVGAARPEGNGGSGPVEKGQAANQTRTEVDQLPQEQQQQQQPPELQRSWMLRYLVAWLPWLSLLHNYDQDLLEQGISRHGTGFDSVLNSPVLGSPTSAAVSAFSPMTSPLASPTLQRKAGTFS